MRSEHDRSSGTLLYEDEIRSVEGLDARGWHAGVTSLGL